MTSDLEGKQGGEFDVLTHVHATASYSHPQGMSHPDAKKHKEHSQKHGLHDERHGDKDLSDEDRAEKHVVVNYEAKALEMDRQGITSVAHHDVDVDAHHMDGDMAQELLETDPSLAHVKLQPGQTDTQESSQSKSGTNTSSSTSMIRSEESYESYIGPDGARVPGSHDALNEPRKERSGKSKYEADSDYLAAMGDLDGEKLKKKKKGTKYVKKNNRVTKIDL